MSSEERHDARFMRDALALGRRHLGLTSPNPSVGAVLVRATEDGPVVVARGITQLGGRPHAETQALDSAGAAARGATLYVSLEPCAHQGKTPPCADAIVAAGVGRVVAAIEDPDGRVAGRGFARLRAAGIALTTGVLEEEARRDHCGHILRATRGRPAVTLKLARTADGFAARRRGSRLYITGRAAQDRIHLMRAHADAILVGVGTVLGDDPELTVRLPGLAARSPVRIVFDSGFRTPRTARLVTMSRVVPTWIVTGGVSPAKTGLERAMREAGVDVIHAGSGADGRIDLAGALAAIAGRGIARVFCEGGPILADALARSDLIDEAVIITSSERLGEAGLPALGPALSARLADPGRMRLVETLVIGPDRIDVHERAG